MTRIWKATTLALATTCAIAIVCIAVAIRRQSYRENVAIVEARVAKLGGHVEFIDDPDEWPAFGKCVVYLDSSSVKDSDLSTVALLPVGTLYLSNTAVTDAGLVHIAKMRSLVSLSVNETSVSDHGIALLNGLNNLDRIDLRNTRVSRDGILELRSCIPDLDVTADDFVD